MYTAKCSKAAIFIGALRPQFLVGSIAPVAVGTAMAYSVTAVFNPVYFLAALFIMMCFQIADQYIQ